MVSNTMEFTARDVQLEVPVVLEGLGMSQEERLERSKGVARYLLNEANPGEVLRAGDNVEALYNRCATESGKRNGLTMDLVDDFAQSAVFALEQLSIPAADEVTRVLLHSRTMVGKLLNKDIRPFEPQFSSRLDIR